MPVLFNKKDLYKASYIIIKIEQYATLTSGGKSAIYYPNIII
ncbi:MAG: hypothetical protein JWQ06_739 [Mucilaginibacter sp.]|nr:hypothetical protein [Mucilaginibacter sp.]